MTDQHCSTCPMGRFCLPADLDPAELAHWTRWYDAGMIEVHHRRIRLLQSDALRNIHRRSRSVPALVRTGHSAIAAAQPAPPILETLSTLAPR